MELWHCPFHSLGGETMGKGEGFKEGCDTVWLENQLLTTEDPIVLALGEKARCISRSNNM